MPRAREYLIVGLFSLIPYIAVAWIYVQNAGQESASVWKATLFLIAVRTFFSVIEWLGSIITWRLYGRRLIIDKIVAILRDNNFPRREYRTDDFCSYVAKIYEDTRFPEAQRQIARDCYRDLQHYETQGIIIGMRMHAASEAALELFSPPAISPLPN